MDIVKHGSRSVGVRVAMFAFSFAYLTYCQGQSLFAIHDSLFRQLPDMLDTARVSIEWGGYVVRPDINECVVNSRERLVGPRLTIYKDKERVGEIETWSPCCRIILRSIRIDSVVTAYSSKHGKYLSAIVSPAYSPCIETNNTTSTPFRHWNFSDIHELMDPISGKTNREHEVKGGSGYIAFTDTMNRPQVWERMSFSDGYRHGFTYTMLKFRNADEFKFYEITTYLKAIQCGLFVRAEDSEHYSVGHIYLTTDPSGKSRRLIRTFLVDHKGKATKYREYVEGESVPSFGKLSKRKKVPLCDPNGIMRCLFPDADPNDYPRSWGEGNNYLNCKEH